MSRSSEQRLAQLEIQARKLVVVDDDGKERILMGMSGQSHAW